MSSFIIIASKLDSDVTRICEALKRKYGFSALLIRFDLEDTLSFAIDENGKTIIHHNNKKLEADPCLIWCRPGPGPIQYLLDKTGQNIQLKHQSWIDLQKALYQNFPDKVFGFRENFVMREQKLAQAKIAKDVGFNIPRSIATNDKKRLMSFFNKNEPLIVKAIETLTIPQYDLVQETNQVYHQSSMTYSTNIAEISQKTARSFIDIPCLYQQKIPKAYELRIPIVGKKTFPFKVDSQKSNISKTDWRTNNRDQSMFQPINIDDDLNQRLVTLLQALDLEYGSIDLIVDPDGTVWFLECNPGGMWTWLDKLIDGAISEATADLAFYHLTKGKLK